MIASRPTVVASNGPWHSLECAPVDHEDPHSRERHEAFSAPLAGQHRRNHSQRGEWPVFGMSLNRAERNQRLARATLRNHSTSPRPELNQIHDRLGLGGAGAPRQIPGGSPKFSLGTGTGSSLRVEREHTAVIGTGQVKARDDGVQPGARSRGFEQLPRLVMLICSRYAYRTPQETAGFDERGAREPSGARANSTNSFRMLASPAGFEPALPP